MARSEIQITYDPDSHSIKAVPYTWPCKAWKFTRKHLESFRAKLPNDVAEFDICGVYLLLSDSAVYVGEGEQVISRLRQHVARPIFDWDVAIAFIAKDPAFEKSHIKYLEHEIWSLLKNIGNYNVENKSEPTRSFVRNNEAMSTYRDIIINLTEICGYPDVFLATSDLRPSSRKSDDIPPKPKSEKTTSYQDVVDAAIKAQQIANFALRYALENNMLTEDDIAFLCSDESGRKFRAGGTTILKITNGDPNDCKDAKGHARYNQKIACVAGKKYLISHELYNKPPRDSRKDLVDYLIARGLTIEKILDLCRAGKTKNSISQ